ncbi:hypothetical protein [Comamonas kerstersii]|nr:hypothetical protein [Comamonas kerstersii]QTW19867.1 hypothetical protein H8N02_05310 [Comamonas kerstersii]
MATHTSFPSPPHLRRVLNTTALAWGFVARRQWSQPTTAAATPLAITY